MTDETTRLAGNPLTLGNRYHLLDRLGEGGMGAVYRALDRLTGETVALKHVALVPGQLQFASQCDEDPTLALAQEFQVLSSLRHPHIIAVRDYGFDLERRPFFTMDLLEQPRTIVQVAQSQPLDIKINLSCPCRSFLMARRSAPSTSRIVPCRAGFGKTTWRC